MSYGQWPYSILPDTQMIPGPAGEDGTIGTSVIAVSEDPVAEIEGYSVAINATSGDVFNWVNDAWVLKGNIGVGVVGPQGPQGIQGPPGATAIASFNFTGPWNALGDYSNTFAVEYGGSVYVVSDDTLAEVGTPPEDGLGNPNPGWALFVAEGAPGPQGPPGVDGIQGPPGIDGAAGANGNDGVSATVSAGTTITGAPGTLAAVSNAGTELNRILNFTIPRGAIGPTGPAGAAGADGADGVGVPAGGLTNYLLAKSSSEDYATYWVDPDTIGGGGGGGGVDALALGAAPLSLPYGGPGRWTIFPSYAGLTPGALTFSAGSQLFILVYVTNAATLASVKINSTANQPASVLDLLWYNTGADGFPSTPNSSLTSRTTGMSTGVRTLTPPVGGLSLTAGLHWMSLHTPTTGTGFSCTTLNVSQHLMQSTANVIAGTFTTAISGAYVISGQLNPVADASGLVIGGSRLTSFPRLVFTLA